MYTIQLHPSIRRAIEVFYRFGLWQNGTNSKFLQFARKLFYLLNVFVFQIQIILSAWITEDDRMVTFLTLVDMCVIITIVKINFLIRNKDVVLFFLSDTIVKHNISDYAVFVQVEQKIRKFMKWINVYIGLVLLAVFVLIIIPLLTTFSNDKKLPTFIMIHSLNSNCNNALMYNWIMYSPLAFQIFLIFVTNLLTVITWFVMFNCSIKYQLLGNDLEHLGDTATSTTDSFHQELIDVVEIHRSTFEYGFLFLFG